MVVYVHGLWLNGWEAGWLRHRLSRQLGCSTCAFPYPSVTADLATNARALAAFLATIGADTLHLVGHSMGGLVILECFESVLSALGVGTSRPAACRRAASCCSPPPCAAAAPPSALPGGHSAGESWG